METETLRSLMLVHLNKCRRLAPGYYRLHNSYFPDGPFSFLSCWRQQSHESIYKETTLIEAVQEMWALWTVSKPSLQPCQLAIQPLKQLKPASPVLQVDLKQNSLVQFQVFRMLHSWTVVFGSPNFIWTLASTRFRFSFLQFILILPNLPF